jgi:hypothetical protein
MILNITDTNDRNMIDKGSQNALVAILDRAAEETNNRALKIVCEDKSRMGPNHALSSAQKQLEGFIHAIMGMSPKNIDELYAAKLIYNANSTIQDIDSTIANEREQNNPCEEDFSKGGGDKIRTSVTSETTNLPEEPASNIETPSLDAKADSEIDAQTDDSQIKEKITEKNSEVETSTKESSQASLIEKPTTKTESKSSAPIEEPNVKNSIVDEEPIFSWQKFNQWAGYSDTDISDKEFLENIGIDATEIPEWIKENNAKWVKQKQLTQNEFVLALENLKSRGII